MDLTPQQLVHRLSRESQARTRAILGDSPTPEAGRAAAQGAYSYADEQLHHLLVLQPEPKAACTKGCSWCCYGGCVAVTVPEAIAIAAQIKDLADETVKAGVMDRLQAQAAFVSQHGAAAAWAPRLACPLLDEAAGTCIVYDSRPLKCRAWASFDAEACKRSTQAGGNNDPSIPLDPAQGLVNEAVQIGQVQALTASGLDGRKYELVTAVLTAIQTPEAIVQWTAGSTIPASLPIPATGPTVSVHRKMTVPSDQRAKNRAKRDRKRRRQQ
jgi:Fe-S-cluster containining protein